MDPTLGQTPQQNLETRQILARVGADLFGESPTTTGRYEIRCKLGAGGMGVVYEAYDPLLDCCVALKQMHAHLVEQPDLLERLRAEARAMAKLRTEPHVVTLYDFFVQHDVFVVMELVRGNTLAAWQREPHSVAELLAMYEQAGRGLAAAHRAGLVHGDFKPDNVLIDAHGVAKVSDFGLARDLAMSPIVPDLELEATAPGGPDATRRSSRSSRVVGTPRYIAPEVLSEARAEHPSDQFAFCVALWEALFDEHPFFPAMARGSSATTLPSPYLASPHAYMYAIAGGALRPAPGSVSVPSRVVAALARGLAHDPGRRFPSMDALLVALCPPPPPRRWFAPLAAAMFAGAGLLSAIPSPEPPPPPTRAELTERAAQRLDEALRLAELPPSVSPHVARELGRYVTRWARQKGALDHEQRRGSTDVATDSRLACLAVARERAILVAKGLHAATVTTEGAIELVEELPSPEECAGMAIDRLTCRLELAKLDAMSLARPVSADLRAALEFEVKGDLPAALTRAKAAAEVARDLDLPLLRGQADYHHGRLLYLSGRADEALVALEQARDAVDPTGCIDLRNDIYSRMIKTAANYGGRASAPAEEWSRQHMMLAMAARDGGARLGDAHNERGLLRLLRLDDPAGALSDFDVALEQRERHLGGGVSSDLADTHLNRGIALYLLDRFDEAMAALDAATEVRTAVFGSEHPLHWREQKARAELLADRGDRKDAEDLLQQALARVEAGIGRDSVPAVRILMSLSGIVERSGDGAHARALALAEDAAARAVGDAMAPDERIEVQLNVLNLRGGADAEARVWALAAAAEADPRVSFETRAEIAVMQASLASRSGEETDPARLAAAAQHADQALTLLMRAGIAPGASRSTRARKIRGVIAIQRDEHDLAIAMLEPLLRAPDHRGMDPNERAQLLHGLVYAYLSRERPGDQERGCQWLRTLRDGPEAPPDEALHDLKKVCRQR